MYFLRVLLLVVWLGSNAGCDDDEGDQSDTGITGDTGESCDLQCFSGWCRDHNQADCVSQVCIGTPDDTYCTIACEIDSHCPEGFVCTEECDDEVAYYPICVREQDLSVLQDLDYCPAK